MDNLVIKTPGVCGGAARIVHTRIRVWTIISYLNLDASPEEIYRNFPVLPPNAIDAALWYYKNNKIEIDQEIQENE